MQRVHQHSKSGVRHHAMTCQKYSYKVHFHQIQSLHAINRAQKVHHILSSQVQAKTYKQKYMTINEMGKVPAKTFHKRNHSGVNTYYRRRLKYRRAVNFSKSVVTML